MHNVFFDNVSIHRKFRGAFWEIYFSRKLKGFHSSERVSFLVAIFRKFKNIVFLSYSSFLDSDLSWRDNGKISLDCMDYDDA